MKIYLNGKVFDLSHLPSPITIEQTLPETLPKNQLQQSFALALNSEFVGKDDYAVTNIKNGDSIDILFPVVGG